MSRFSGTCDCQCGNCQNKLHQHCEFNCDEQARKDSEDDAMSEV